MTEERYWHFLREDGCLNYPPHTKVEPGQTLRAEGDLALCVNGMHASNRAIDALGYAPGPIVCRVTIGGLILHDSDKACARERTVLWMADATRTLHEFAVWCAEQALLREREAGREPDPRSWQALEVKRQWLRGEVTDEALTSARDAAWGAEAAARAAAWGAARDAAEAAARAAARDARDAARAAARDAARDAAWDAAWDAARGAQNIELTRRLLALAPEEWREG